MIVKFGHFEKWELNEYECDTMKEAFHWVGELIKSRKEKWYYSNINFSKEKNTFELDYGSWTYGFSFQDMTEDNWQEWFDRQNKEYKPNKLEKMGIPISETEYGRNR